MAAYKKFDARVLKPRRRTALNQLAGSDLANWRGGRTTALRSRPCARAVITLMEHSKGAENADVSDYGTAGIITGRARSDQRRTIELVAALLQERRSQRGPAEGHASRRCKSMT